MKAIKIDDTGSVLVESNDIKVWVDVWEKDGELMADWNQYIFYLNDENDLKIKSFQENIDNFEEATSVAISYYESNFKANERN